MVEYGLNDAVVVITGGARGIGRALSDSFLRAGARIALIGRSQESLDDACKLDGVVRERAMGVRCDVSDYQAVKKSIAQIVERYKTISVLINCAAIQAPIGPFDEVDFEDWRKNCEINLFGTAACCHAVIPYMKAQGGGRIINFSGGGATSSRPHFSAYATAKAGVVRFTEVLADELHSDAIYVNAVAPGAINTGMLEEILAAESLEGTQELLRAQKQHETGGSSLEQVCELVQFLASNYSYTLSGRLLSAVWDDWRSLGKDEITSLMSSEKYTLRRITQ